MADDDRRLYSPKTVSHPGEMVMEYLEAYDWTQRELARRAGLTPKTVSEICGGKAPISPMTALALENVFRRPAHFWLNLQRAYDESRAREIAKGSRSTWLEWSKNFPIKEMRSHGFLDEDADPVDGILGFFGVSSPESWRAVVGEANVAYRQTSRFEISEFSVAVWIRATEMEASKIEVATFDAEKLRGSLDTLRRISRDGPETFIGSTQAVCAQAGVAVVWMPALKRTGISGCARWISDKKAMIAVSLRYKTDDQLWFTFFHELGHVLLHRKRNGFILDNVKASEETEIDPEIRKQEDEADRFAADTLIPPREFAQFVRARSFTTEAIYSFAEEMGISPGIVVGRLQKDSYLRHDQGNKLKRKLEWQLKESDSID